METSFLDLIGCTHPVQLAGIGGGVGGPDLAAAVRDAGGLGMVSWTEPVPSGCGVNFLVPFVDRAAVVDAARRSDLMEFFYGDPDTELAAAAHDSGAIVGWQVGSVEEARAAASVGADYVVAQGIEAGGHVRGRSPLDELLDRVVEVVRVPIVAAGGIATPERVAELMARGAAAVRVGTRFVTCVESQAHEQYVGNLLAATGDDTVLTGWFDEGWPDAPHRVLRSALEAAQGSGWRSAQPPSRGSDRPVADMAQYAGTGVGHVTRAQSAAEVIQDLVSLLR